MLSQKPLRHIFQGRMIAPEASPFMPVFFVGHGSPLDAVGDTLYSRGWANVARSIPEPSAILAISAHWLSRGSRITAMDHPPTIHDFYGFPEELYAIEYPAPGSATLASRVQSLLLPSVVSPDREWGLDHGTWTVLRHMFPAATIPVVQLSLDTGLDAAAHYALARRLLPLRSEGVLIVASGDIVHNLREMQPNLKHGFDWAVSVNEAVKGWITEHRHDDIIHYERHGANFHRAIPTPEHYWPLLYALALQQPDEGSAFINDSIALGSISMTSVLIGG